MLIERYLEGDDKGDHLQSMSALFSDGTSTGEQSLGIVLTQIHVLMEIG